MYTHNKKSQTCVCGQPSLWTLDLETIYRTSVSVIDVLIIDIHLLMKVEQFFIIACNSVS